MKCGGLARCWQMCKNNSVVWWRLWRSFHGGQQVDEGKGRQEEERPEADQLVPARLSCGAVCCQILDVLQVFSMSLDFTFKYVLFSLHFGYFPGLNVTFVFINKFMTWMEAQSYCRANYTDLASVRNMSENQKAKELVPAGQSAWIGLFRDSWKWTDGSNFSFRYWNTYEPSNVVKNEFCVAANFGSTGKWEDWNCDRETAFVLISY
uniref:C-type lectin domain-containing protein n=1 Tax=Pundamilia nyererei TaxID=303518 RepID=A0A3B4F809_9CICH